MKKLLAILMTLCLLCAAAACAENQLPEPFTLRNGIRFGMNLSEVTALEKVRYHDLDVEDTSGPVSFTELEYEQMRENDVPCEIKYLFVDDGLVAVKFNYETRFISYARLKDELTALYGKLLCWTSRHWATPSMPSTMTAGRSGRRRAGRWAIR